jgi:hypothetical protein
MGLNINFHNYFDCTNVLVSTSNANRNPYMTAYAETHMQNIDDGQ